MLKSGCGSRVTGGLGSSCNSVWHRRRGVQDVDFVGRSGTVCLRLDDRRHDSWTGDGRVQSIPSHSAQTSPRCKGNRHPIGSRCDRRQLPHRRDLAQQRQHVSCQYVAPLRREARITLRRLSHDVRDKPVISPWHPRNKTWECFGEVGIVEFGLYWGFIVRNFWWIRELGKFAFSLPFFRSVHQLYAIRETIVFIRLIFLF